MRRLAVIACLAGFLAPWAPGLERIEHVLYDLRLQAANRLAPGRIRMDPRIVVVGVEPESYQSIAEHPVFWLPLCTRVAQHALDLGAARVALDLLPTYAEPKATEAFAPLAATGKLTMIAYWDSQQVQAPPAGLVLPLGVGNLALANLSLDGDGVARRQQVAPIRTAALYGRSDWDFLAASLAGGVAGEDCWINYSPAQPVRFSFHEFLRQTPDLNNSIVLIGSRARIDQDLVFSPLGGSIFGVDYQAQVLNTLLQKRSLGSLPAGPWLALCLLLIAYGRRLRALIATTLVLWWAASLGLLIWADRLLPLAPAFLGIPLMGSLAALTRWQAERQQRLRLLQVMSGYVAPEILAEMLAEPASWLRSLNQRREVTILFADINGFSSVCEQHPPEQIATWLDRYYQEMTAVLFAHQGTIIRFVGDQFMVLFGSPKPTADPEARAVKAALAMQARLLELKSTGETGFHQIKIGIHCGSMLLAVLGNDLKREYTAIGDETNVAARIQELCKQLEQPLLVSQEIQERLQDLFQFDFQGEHEVKGRRQPVRVYSVRA